MVTGSTAPPKRARIYVLVAVSLFLVIGSWYLTRQEDVGTIVVTFPSGTQLETEVADTPEKIFFGLAFRDSLPYDGGMLYIYEKSDLYRVHTRGFRFPVDVIWADESRHVVHVVEHAPPCPGDPCPMFGPGSDKARYIIQTAAGFVGAERVVPGMELKFALRM